MILIYTVLFPRRLCLASRTTLTFNILAIIYRYHCSFLPRQFRFLSLFHHKPLLFSQRLIVKQSLALCQPTSAIVPSVFSIDGTDGTDGTDGADATAQCVFVLMTAMPSIILLHHFVHFCNGCLIVRK